MQLTSLKVITIIAESILEEKIVLGMKKLGAKGYTVVQSHGEGSRRMRSGELPGENIRIESLVSQEIAERIMAFIATDFFPNFSVICFLTDANVLRGEKFL